MAEPAIKFEPQPLQAIPSPPERPTQPQANASGQIPQSARSVYDAALRQYQSDMAAYERRVDTIRAENRRIEQSNREGSERASKAAADAAERSAAAAEAAAKNKAVQDKAAADAAATERTVQVAMSAGATIAGMAIGHAGAHLIKKSHAAHVAAVAPAAKSLATKAGPLISAAVKDTAAGKVALDKLAGVVATAQKMKIGRIAGPVGVVSAGLLLAEGAFSRFVLAPSIESKTGSEAASAVGTASLFAATSLVGTRMLQNAMPQAVPPSANAVATIEGAKNVVARMTPASASPGAAAAARQVVSSIAALARRSAPAVLLATAATAAAASLMTPLPATAKSVPDSGPAVPPSSGSADLARQAAARTAEDMTRVQTVGAAGPQPPAAPVSDGRVDGYTRQQNGKSVFVHGYQRTP